jgi:cytochrome P450 family 307 subfamily A
LTVLHPPVAKKKPFYFLSFCVQQYGPVVGLRLGVTRCAVVQNDDVIREVLITKADHFDSRPNFVRFHAIFGGSKKNGESCKNPDPEWIRIQ